MNEWKFFNERTMSDLNATHIYQAFFFDNRVKAHFYPGNVFMGYREGHTVEELIGLAGEIMEADDGKIMPKLTDQIEHLLGEGNFVCDFWEFGSDCFSLYWWIRKDVYHEKLALIRQWAEYAGINEWMEINEEVQG